ncbi:aldo/keto reductase [Paenibacillus hamazuiensis]|uniref:aldo/keto reductase n=1 Tax=Paenibacillus hamazuiensis TaxID=2936508 RepID=UPI00200BD03C|nr:aldo/keto reductase [Paenibacillus hamazuiensis]
MKRTKITGTELVSSSISLGGVALGSKLNEEESFRLMDEYTDLGGNMIDTAEVYANWLPVEPSVSEKTIGRWMKSRNNRHKLIVTTKGAHPRLETMNVPRLSPAEIVQDLDDSLQRLQVDTIDLYWLHRDDTNRQIGEILETLNGQVKAGKIRYFGCSNWTAARIREAQQYAAAHRIQGFSGNQMMWSLAEADRTQLGDPTLVTMDSESKQLHLETGLTAVPYSSQAQGLFTKLASGALSFDDGQIKPHYRTEVNRGRLQRVRQFAAEYSLTVTQVVLGYLLSQPFSTIPIVGCYTREQLHECMLADRVHFTGEQLAYLENGN